MNAKALLSIVVAAACASWRTPARAGEALPASARMSAVLRRWSRKSIVFPADHGPHPDYRVEWWYVTANLKDANGQAMACSGRCSGRRRPATRRGLGEPQLWMGHAAVTSAATHRFAERFARGGVGQAGVEPRRSRPGSTTGSMRSLGGSGFAPLELTASAKDFSYALKLESDRPVVLQGDAGFSGKSERGQASYYYSQPYLRVSGTIVLDGKSIAVSGQGWIDREWSSQPLGADQTGWDWFSLHLDGGEKLMLFRLRMPDGKHFFAGNWIGLDGRSEPLDPRYHADARRHHRVAGRDVPTAWNVGFPPQAGDRKRAAQPAKLDGHALQYWEGPSPSRQPRRHRLSGDDRVLNSHGLSAAHQGYVLCRSARSPSCWRRRRRCAPATSSPGSPRPSAEERIAAQMALADVPLTAFLDEAARPVRRRRSHAPDRRHARRGRRSRRSPH